MLPELFFKNNTAQFDLWNRIKEFQFVAPGTVLTFANKLATLNKWPVSFATEVIEEYRKFIFLCCISPTGASPSKYVDEAWHLHLTYTISYWNDWCKDTLQKDIHHYPSKGGEKENHRHEQWYKETLALYELVFGQAPRRDIWPAADEEISGIIEPALPGENRHDYLIYFTMALPFVFIIFKYNVLSPYSLNGPVFLFFYAFLFTAFIIAIVISSRVETARMKLVFQQNFPKDIHPLQIAEFVHGKDRTVQAAVLDLVNKELLLAKDWHTLKVNTDLQNPVISQNPFTRQLILTQQGSTIEYREIHDCWYKSNSFSHPCYLSFRQCSINPTKSSRG